MKEARRPEGNFLPDRLGQFRDALALYRRHGWTLARVLMTSPTLAELAPATDADVADATDADADATPAFEGVAVRESDVDAIWLRRPSAGGREAWELRLISDPPYALFELFEPDELEEDREDVRREMEARLSEYAGGGPTHKDDI
jgi:hypothetical protein